VRIELTRSGGVAALELTTAVDSVELPDPDARQLATLVGEIDLVDLAARSPLRGRGADRFQYDLVVSDEGARHEITVSEDTAPPEVRALTNWLMDRAKQARRTSEQP
jgi:hypothetical protein